MFRRTLISILLTVAAAPFAMAQHFTTARISGERQGDFRGNVVARGYEGQLRVRRFEMGMSRSAAGGVPAARRVYEPVRLVVDWSPASIQLMQALNSNEVLDIRISFVRASSRPTGGNETRLVQQVRLRDVSLVSVRRIVRDLPLEGLQDRSSTDAGHSQTDLDEITLTFGRIDFEEFDRGFQFLDDLRVRF